jgi:hypothetical protein
MIFCKVVERYLDYQLLTGTKELALLHELSFYGGPIDDCLIESPD